MTSTTTPGMIKVWVKINGNEPEKVEIRDDSDIDDLKNELFIRNKEEKRQYYSIFNNERLSSSTHVPNNTTCERPILLFKTDENYRENDGDDMDTARVTATNLNAGKNRKISFTKIFEKGRYRLEVLSELRILHDADIDVQNDSSFCCAVSVELSSENSKVAMF